MKIRIIFLLYFIVPIIITVFGIEIWVRTNGLVDKGLDRVMHPYIGPGGFYNGGYFKHNIDVAESFEAFGYTPKGWLNIPSYEYGTSINSSKERGHFLFRDRVDAVIAEKKKDEFRIFILGGSVAFGEGASSPEKRWFIVLEKLLREKTKKNIVVIPAANHSHVSTQERVILDLYVMPYQPDALVVLSGFNDANTGITATRPGDPYGQSIIYAHDISPFYGLLNDLSKHFESVRYLLQRSVFAIWFGDKVYDKQKDLAQAKSVSNVFYDNQAQTKKRCDAENIKCFFYLQPFWDITKANRKIAKLNVYEMVTINYIRYLQDISKYTFMNDLTGVFDTEPAKIPFIDPAHFNDEGHQVLAEKIASHMLKSGLFQR